jgi:adenylate kinase family enzyme
VLNGRAANPKAKCSARLGVPHYPVVGGTRFRDTTWMSRVVVVGVSGSGKTTLSGELSRRLRVPHIELDSIFWQANWTQLPPEQFEARVKDACAGQSWVVDGNYAAAIRELVWTAADTVIWLDLPRAVVMRQLVLRTVRRTLTRAELWNGNRERPLRDQLSFDPRRSILAWSWTDHGRTRVQYAHAMDDPRFGQVRFVRIRSRRELRRFLEGDAMLSTSSPA